MHGGGLRSPLNACGLCLGLKRKKNETGRMNRFEDEKREFHAHIVTWLVSTRQNLSHVPGGFFYQRWPMIFFSHFLPFSIWLPCSPYVRFVPVAAERSRYTHSSVHFHQRIQACDEAAPWYRQDPVRLIGASDTQAGSKRNTKMAAACSVCLHVAMSDVSRADVKDIPNKTSIFFPLFFSQKIKQAPLLFHHFSLTRSSFLSPSSSSSSFLSSSSILLFSTKTRVI